MQRKLAVGALIFVVAVAVIAALVPSQAKKPQPPVDCSIVLCPAPDCPGGTKAVILPGDCCFTCVPTK